MTKTSTNRFLAVLLMIIFCQLAGPLLLLLYKATINHFEHPLNLTIARLDVAPLLASFSFTLLGFFATLMTAIFGLARTETLAKYRNKYGPGFIILCLSVILNLCLTFFFSLAAMVKENDAAWLTVGAVTAVNSLFGISLVSVITYNLSNEKK